MAAVLILSAGFAAPLAATYRRGDFFGFWAAARAIVEGASPYDPIWFGEVARRADAVLSFGRSVYPPWTAVVLVPLAVLPFGAAAVGWLAIQLAAAGGATLLFARRIRRAERPVLIALVAASQPLWLLVVGGNITGLMTGAIGGSILAAGAGRPLLAGACFGLVALKPHPFLFVGVAVLLAAKGRERWRFIAGTVLSAGSLVGIAVAIRPAWIAEWLAALGEIQSTAGSNATLWTIDRIAGGAASPEVALVTAALAITVAIGAWVLWYRTVSPPLDLAMSGALPISLAVAPHGWSYDQLVLLVPLAVILQTLGRRSPAVRRRGIVALALASAIIPWALYVLAFRRGGEELSVVTPLLVFAAFWCVRPEQTGWRRTAARSAAGPWSAAAESEDTEEEAR